MHRRIDKGGGTCKAPDMAATSPVEVADAIVASWGPDTMYATKEVPIAEAGLPLARPVRTTAAVLQDWLGGDILTADVYRDGQLVGAHYWNRLPGGEEVDLTADQFLPNEAVVGRREVPRPADEAWQAHPGHAPYLVLKQRVAARLGGGPQVAGETSV